MLIFRKWIGPLLAGLVLAGCQTSADHESTGPAPITEVVLLPEIKLPALGQNNIETNEPPILIPPPTPAAPALVWPTNSAHPGWIALETWTALNHLGPPQRLSTGPEPNFAVATTNGLVSIKIGSHTARWNGWNVWLGYAPKLFNGEPHLALLDAVKTFQPLLQPNAPATKTNRVLVLDPGHGGADSGTFGTKQQLEKSFTLDWALRVQAILRTNGWKVLLTRTTDLDVPLSARVAFADQANADLFVSLHFNSASPHQSPSGLETYCLTPVGSPSSLTRNFEDNQRLTFPNNSFDRENVQLAFRLHRELLNATHATDGGVRRARFMAVLRGQHRPAVLIEGGYLSNPAEARLIASPAYRQKLAEAVARALE